MGLRSDLRTIRHMVFPRVAGETPAERMESYYRSTAGDYDAFRERLLHGRRELMARLPTAPGAHLVDMGAGTGNNITYLGERHRKECRRITLVDVSASMLEVARRRVERSGWDNVETVLASATDYRPADGQADIVVFSYALTMMPDWFTAVDHARAILRPGGTIAVCDFYVARKQPAGGARHAAWRRHLWPAWFSHNNVFLSPDHLPYLRARFTPTHVRESLSSVPYLPAKVPYYLFTGTKD
ncbi:class I SAM-dependent methyltransferase [Streptomyces ficellus]|uniref:Methyltransferase domain-containing protein n=1 Tax=Streptomyces ficellus TaxID=1977088 RepID=A0A6I6FG80_9ACTN|nr:methyltransferase domain-containing protein [Streptomyces ficellus]QGV82061.1 methyltransferase domain-containing protein [Streptomyces ficellus]